uniref:Uncharacterized protein n=1 Tax=Rhizophora mucronata TaxID=61149 RepID=A0A2P2R375_RHIMU
MAVFGTSQRMFELLVKMEHMKLWYANTRFSRN